MTHTAREERLEIFAGGGRQLLWLGAMLLATLTAVPPSRAAGPQTIVDLLRSLMSTGVDVIYSTELVPPGLEAPVPLNGTYPMSRVVEALAARGLMLQVVGLRSYVVTRRAMPSKSPPAPAPSSVVSPQPLDELSVFATRYELAASSIGEPVTFDARSMTQAGGSDADALRSLHSAPVLATNLSARPYIRGAMLEDVLVEYDGITLADPFHFKNFQSVLSIFDPATVSRADIFTGGFPVGYGTRSGGVLDLTPRSIESGSEYIIGASTLNYTVGSVGRGDVWPIEWLFNARTSIDHSTVQPLAGVYGEPRFSDGVGRLRWVASDTSAVTLGLVMLDDRIMLSSGSAEEQATDLSRDLDTWLRWEWEPSGELSSRTSISLGNTERNSSGRLDLPGLAQGTLDAERSFNTRTLRSEWTYAASPAWRWDFGGEFTRETAELTFIRNESFTAPIVLGFGQPSSASIISNIAPRSSTWGLFASALARWHGWEADAGMRLDGQTYQDFGSRAQLSPRLNLRYDIADDWHGYGALGQFDQAQRVDEYRAEQNQTTPDSATRALRALVGIAHESSAAEDWRVEAYRNHWFRVSPYYDNLLGSVSITPQLSPDRVLISPRDAEAAGVELTTRHSFGPHVEAWSIYSIARVTDDIQGRNVARSWDQTHAANLGIAWADEHTALSGLLGWHSGWPSTPLMSIAANSPAGAYWAAGYRNSTRWGSYLSADLRVATSIPLAHGEVTFWVDATNVTNRANECCIDPGTFDGGARPSAIVERYWAPRVINVGFSWRARHRH